MAPHINDTSFGSITVDGQTYDHDIVIRLSGEIIKRKKKLSKKIYGTSHKISKDEAKFVYEAGAQVIFVGTGQSGMAEISEKAAKYFQKHGLRCRALPTREAIELFNRSKEPKIGLFHVTC
jgi:hypothetical protein